MIEKIFKLFGYQKHQCVNCKKTNYLKGKGVNEWIAGFCWRCKHPVFWILLLAVVMQGCRSYHIYIVELPKTEVIQPVQTLESNRFESSFIKADSVFMNNLRKASREASQNAWKQIKPHVPGK
ncbi:MAG: hypothetical protein ACK5KT_11335 [Dysgonomonas sp.]